MPKVVTSSSRRLRSPQRQNDAHHHQSASSSSLAHSSILLNAPRKVSFEDGHQSSSSFTSSLSSSSSTQVTSSCSTSSSSIASSLGSSRSSLRRKAPSVCLVGLASEDLPASSCLSPMPTATEEEEEGEANAAPSSPWGHFVDILVPLEEQQDEPPRHKRRLGDAPLFHLGMESDEDSCSLSFQPLTKKHKHRRCWTSPHPYGLQPRPQRRRMRSTSHQHHHDQPSFLPGFFLEGPTPAPLDRPDASPVEPSTKEVEKALRRLQV